MKGRPAKPQKIIDLQGGRELTHRPPRNEPNPPESIPTCPDHLNDVAKKEWDRLIPILAPIGILTEADRTMLAAHCEAFSRWVEATKQIQKMGMIYAEGRKVKKKVDKAGNLIEEVISPGIPKANPYLKIARDALDQMKSTGMELGLSPQSRARLSISQEKKSPEQDKVNEFRLLKHKKA